MKRWVIPLLFLLCLTGCAEETFETMEDTVIPVSAAAPQQVLVQLPQDADVLTAADDGTAQLYGGDGYTISLQTLPSGNLDETLRQLTGFDQTQLQVIESVKLDAKRYDCVYTSAGENGLQVGRVCILDDGNYHYALCTLADEQVSGNLRETWSELYGSFRLTAEQWDPNTAS